MSFYRKVPTRLWLADERFRSLSGARPNGQTLFLYLITGPHTTLIPGLWVFSPSEAADFLRWPRPGIQKALRELAGQGLAELDSTSCVIWVPTVFEIDRPPNPKVVMGWRRYWTQIPACDLKKRASACFETWLSGMGDSYLDAFRNVLRDDIPNGIGKSLGNQEQYREQQHAQELPANQCDDVDRGFDRFWAAYPKKRGRAEAETEWLRINPSNELTGFILEALAVQAGLDSWREEDGRYVPLPVNWLVGRRWEDEVTEEGLAGVEP